MSHRRLAATLSLFGSLFLVILILLTEIQCTPHPGSLSSGSQAEADSIVPYVVPFDMPQLRKPEFPPLRVSILDCQAQEGGTVKCTEAIREAISRVTNAGGGTVVIPKGKWLTGAIRLANNINLYLEEGAELLFSQDTSDYLPVVFSRHEDVECYKYSAFIYAEGVHNIAITGKGVLNGQGKPWWSYKTDRKQSEVLLYEMGKNGVPLNERIFDGSNGRALRPAFFQPMNCTNILVEGVTFLYGAFWTITPTYCENIIVRNIRIETEGDYGHTPNGDGVDPSSCRNMLIENCIFDTGDDCIAIKAGRDNDGLRVNKPTENIVIRNCRGLRGHGGIVIGSETSGSIRNIVAEHCEFSGTDRIVRIKTARGRGGIIENMWFSNMRGDNIQLEALHLNMLYTGNRLPAQPLTQTTPVIRNIHYDSIICSSGKTYAIEILGLPEQNVENITFTNIIATTEKGVNISDAKGIQISHSYFKSSVPPLIQVTDAKEIMLDNITIPGDVQKYLAVEGPSSSAITVQRTIIPNGKQGIVLGNDVPQNAVLIKE